MSGAMTTIILLTIQHKYIEREEGGGAQLCHQTTFLSFIRFQLPSCINFLLCFSLPIFPSLVFPYFFSLVSHLLRWFLNSALSFIPSFYPRSLDWGGFLISVVYILVMLSHLHGLTSQNGSDHKSSDFISLFQLHILHTDKYYIVYLYYFNYMITYPSTACNTDWRDMYRQSSFAQIRRRTIS